MPNIFDFKSSAYDVMASKPDGEWGLGLENTDIAINSIGSYQMLTGASKCAQQVMIALLWLKNEKDPINPNMGTQIATIYGGKNNPAVIIPIITMQAKDALKRLYAAQISAGLPDTEVLNINTVKIGTRFEYVANQKTVIVLTLSAQTVFGDDLPDVPIPLTI